MCMTGTLRLSFAIMDLSLSYRELYESESVDGSEWDFGSHIWDSYYILRKSYAQIASFLCRTQQFLI